MIGCRPRKPPRPVPRKVNAHHEPDQSSEQVIEAASELGLDVGQIAERGGDLETCEHLATRTGPGP